MTEQDPYITYENMLCSFLQKNNHSRKESVLPILLGLSIISNGAFQLVLGLNTKSVAWIIYSVILVIGGALLLFNPFASLLILLQVFGYTLIAMGILEVIGYFMFRSQLNK